MQPCVITYASTPLEIFPRLLWQQIFNLYRENDCDLNQMDNILLDFERCKKIDPASSCRFLWTCNPGGYETDWVPINNEDDLNEILATRNFYFAALFTVVDNHVTWERLIRRREGYGN